ncbi:MAG: hypothetical protein FWG90_05445 [Oscillospiraceae bacterium]|nr:hypothetical protein [Oscillospiraceae bacterium]
MSYAKIYIIAKIRYSKNGVNEIGLAFITREHISANDFTFETNPNCYGFSPGVRVAKNSSVSVNPLTKEMYSLINEREGGNLDYYLSLFHNHGTGASFCFVDIATFLVVTKVISTLLDTSSYIYVLRKNPAYENIFNAPNDERTKQAQLDLIKEILEIVRLGLKAFNFRMSALRGNVAAQNLLKDIYCDWVWGRVSCEIQKSTFLERYRIPKSDLNVLCLEIIKSLDEDKNEAKEEFDLSKAELLSLFEDIP